MTVDITSILMEEGGDADHYSDKLMELMEDHTYEDFPPVAVATATLLTAVTNMRALDISIEHIVKLVKICSQTYDLRFNSNGAHGSNAANDITPNISSH